MQIRQRILEGRWQTLIADRGLCRELTNYCCMCQTWCAQTKSLAAHLKKEHGDLLSNSAQHRADIDQHVRWGTQCHVCEQAVQKTHKCPVTMQLAVLKQHLQTTPTELRPESLQLPMPSQKRRSPFDGAHEDEVPIFDARRDCRGGYDICSHCRDHVGLRRHIECRRCLKFDASKPPQDCILRYQPAVHELFQVAHPERWLFDRDFLARLKQECALCGRLFDSAKRFAAHLAADHQPAYDEAQPHAQHLLNHFQPLGEACLCGVWLRNADQGHQCAVAIQFGLLRMLVRQNTEPPTLGTIPNLLDYWLQKEDYDKAWHHPEYAYFFGNYCSLCLNRALSLEEYHSHMLPDAIAHLDRVLASRHACCSACVNLSLKPAEVLLGAPLL